MVSFIDIQIFTINGVCVIYTDFILKCTCNLLISGVFFCVFYFYLCLFLEKGKWKRNCSPNKGNGSQGINGECIQFTVYNTPQQLKKLAKPKLKENSKMTFSVFLKTEIKRREEMKERQKSLQMEIMVRCHEWIQCHQLLKHNFTFKKKRFIFY